MGLDANTGPPEAVPELSLHVPQHHEGLLLGWVGVGDAVESNHRQRAGQSGQVGRGLGVEDDLAWEQRKLVHSVQTVAHLKVMNALSHVTGFSSSNVCL